MGGGFGRYGIYFILLGLAACARDRDPDVSPTRVEVFSLFDDETEKTAWNARVYPQIAPFLKKWTDAGFKFSQDRLAIEIEPRGSALKGKKFSDFYGPDYPQKLNSLALLLNDPTQEIQLLSGAIAFAAQFPPTFWDELESSQSTLDINLKREIERQVRMANQPVPELSDNLNRQGGIGSMRYLAAADLHFIYLGRSGEFSEQPYLQPAVVFHEIIHALLNSQTKLIKPFRVLDEAVADGIAQVTIGSPCVLKLEVPGKHGDGCYRKMDRPSLPLAQSLWEAGPNVAEYRNGQTIRRFLWDFYREVGAEEFHRNIIFGIKGLPEILETSSADASLQTWKKRDPFVEEFIYQRETFRSAQFFFEAICLGSPESKVCRRMNDYLGFRNGPAIENLIRFAPSQLKGGKSPDGAVQFYRDAEDQVWKAKYLGLEFSESRADRDESNQTVWLRFKSKDSCFEWVSSGKVRDCRPD